MLKKVSIQGIRGSYSDTAASLFGLGDERISFESFAETLEAVARGSADLAVVPTFNSIIGRVGEVNELIDGFELRKVRVAALEIRHALIGPEGSRLEDLRRVSSHREALRQCSLFFDANPGLAIEEDADTATAVRRVVESGDRSRAAIGSVSAAEIYGGIVLLDSVANRNKNVTTFCLVKK